MVVVAYVLLQWFASGSMAQITNPLCFCLTEVFLEAAVVFGLFFASSVFFKKMGQRKKEQKRQQAKVSCGDPVGNHSSHEATLQSNTVSNAANKGANAGRKDVRDAAVAEDVSDDSRASNGSVSGDSALRRPMARRAPAHLPEATVPFARPASPCGSLSGADSDDWRKSPVSQRPAFVKFEPDPVEKSRLVQFIELNDLDSRCESMLQRLQPAQAEWVMDQDFLVDVDPSKATASSKVVYTISKSMTMSEDFWTMYPTSRDIKKRLATFADLNNLDERCLQTLQRLPEDRLASVMDAEFVLKVDSSKGTASAKVIGRVLRKGGFP